MAKTLEQWLDSDVAVVKDKPVRWLSEHYFFRDPIRPIHSDPSFFFAPADGVIVYQTTVVPDQGMVNIKGKNYSLQEAMRDPQYDKPSVVIGIFMTFYDVHINRVPYAGRLSYKELEPVDSFNYPMLEVEKEILDELRVNLHNAEYMQNNQRTLNRVYSPYLDQCYYILQIADYDVDSITPFELKQNRPYPQNHRFSQIRYGSQVDLIVPLSERYDLELMQDPGVHVEAGIDALIRITRKDHHMGLNLE